MPAATTIERDGRSAIVRLRGDVVIASSRRLWAQLRPLAKRRDVESLTIDFSGAGRMDSSGVAMVSLLRDQMERQGRQLELVELSDEQEAALALAPTERAAPQATHHSQGFIELIGHHVYATGESAAAMGRLIKETVSHAIGVVARRERLPTGALAEQIAKMGADAIGIVGLLSFLLGMTMSFQGAVQLQRLGAGPFVADLIGVSMVREIAPMMTAVILTGRTGAAIAAELGTMRVRSELDALQTMGISPARYLLVPRIGAITIVGPALTLMGMFIGCAGGMIVAAFALDLSPITFWMRMLQRLTAGDFAHGLVKSLVFAWIIGFAGSHLGMRARGDASSVGSATTRTVVVSVFFIIMVDAIFATITTLVKYR
ncbi:MAG TPA: ABC transporter permease [Kofleriaceae bacterium]|jgi:phospholipid/cholesterol/gamma-HCH transport system permease protein